MPYHMEWLIEGRLVYQRCYGDLTIEELHTINLEFIEHIKAGIPLVHTLVDLAEVGEYPKSLTELSRAFARDNEVLQRQGWTLVISAHPVLRFFASIITAMWNRARFRMFTTHEEALLFLAELDTSLEPAHISQARAKITKSASRS